jgi:hypothetical protein
MTQSTSSDTQKQQSGGTHTEADAKSTVKPDDKSSHDHMSREKAGSDKGAGGGAKQEQQH